ncbi:MAG: hypothetical protein KC561_00010 [Myxococcales bacterium]|nr:hypothetical protein [Myxococcales bacterium]
MKRRDFLTFVSSATAATALSAGTGCRDTELSADGAGELTISPWRQGAGYPVTVELRLGDELPSESPPAPMIVREGLEGWSHVLSPDDAEQVDERTWRWQWTPALVPPTSQEKQEQLVRYRAVLLEPGTSSPAAMSNPVELVCVLRGWGA